MGKNLKIALRETINLKESLRPYGKSGAKNKEGKPIHEVKQYVGTKDPNVISRIDILRSNGVTRVLHRLWRKSIGLVHKNWK